MSTERASNTRATRATRGQKLLLLASLLTMVFLATGQKEPQYDEDCCLESILLVDVDKIVDLLQLLAGRKRDRIIVTPSSAAGKPGQSFEFDVKLKSLLAATFNKGFTSGSYLGSADILPKGLTDVATLKVVLKTTSELLERIKDDIRFGLTATEFTLKEWKEKHVQDLLKAGKNVSIPGSNDYTVYVGVNASRDTDPDEIWTDSIFPSSALVQVDKQQVLAELGLAGN